MDIESQPFGAPQHLPRRAAKRLMLSVNLRLPKKQWISPVILEESNSWEQVWSFLRKDKIEATSKTMSNQRIRIQVKSVDQYKKLTRQLGAPEGNQQRSINNPQGRGLRNQIWGQGFHYAMGNCKVDPRCAKCGKKHSTRDLQKAATSPDVPVCQCPLVKKTASEKKKKPSSIKEKCQAKDQLTKDEKSG